ncbi:MAG TPA: hypothetical protein VG994_19910 [Steroidobacteraceae bacterium]|nr:hypothetical protein [Steroidobacteraceae bacterium]
MNRSNGKRTSLPEQSDTAPPESSSDRRRLGHIVHDDRGSAFVEWRNAPDDHDRPVFRIEGSGVKEPLSLQNEDTYDPYDRKPVRTRERPAKGGKRDLRKLSEWMKLMRAMEERKKRGEDD